MQPILRGLFLFAITSLSYADICNNLTGNWEGHWIDETERAQNAKLSIGPLTQQQFSGGFMLADGSVGKLSGQCTAINEHEAYIKLQEDAPDYNPCRGAIVFYKGIFMSHFYCFNPNQAGYFNKAV